MIKESARYSQVICSLVKGIAPSKYPIRKICSNLSFLRQSKLFDCQNYGKNKTLKNRISLLGKFPLFFCHFTAAINWYKIEKATAFLPA